MYLWWEHFEATMVSINIIHTLTIRVNRIHRTTAETLVIYQGDTMTNSQSRTRSECGRCSGRVIGPMSERASPRVREWVNERVREWARVWMSEWTSEWKLVNSASIYIIFLYHKILTMLYIMHSIMRDKHNICSRLFREKLLQMLPISSDRMRDYDYWWFLLARGSFVVL